MIVRQPKSTPKSTRTKSPAKPAPPPFTFEADGHTFVCSVETGRKPGDEPWWWFTVTGDAQRYAPFLAGADDTHDSVQVRILAYYRAMIERRSMPLDARSTWELRRQNLAALKK